MFLKLYNKYILEKLFVFLKKEAKVSNKEVLHYLKCVKC